MIEYRQTYEIDGSDTSYDLVVPEREKCIELLKYYFKLKIIHKGRPIKIYKAVGKESRRLTNQEFASENTEDLWYIIRNCDLKFIVLQYTYVAPNSLYPEVKRELIDILLKHTGVKHTFINPMFSEPYEMINYITIDFDCRPFDYHYDLACSDSYYAIVSKNTPFLNIIFDCSLGGPHELMFYGLSKIRDAFPEFEIDLHLNEELLCYYEIKWDQLIKEGILVESMDYKYTLERILTNPFVTLNHDGSKQIRLAHLPSGIEKFDPLKIFIDEDSSVNPRGWTKDVINHYTALRGIMGKSTLSIDEYVEKVQKLAHAEIFGDADFESYISFTFRIQTAKDNEQNCIVKFVRTSTGPKMLILAPYKYRDRIIQLLRL